MVLGLGTAPLGLGTVPLRLGTVPLGLGKMLLVRIRPGILDCLFHY